MKMKTFSLLAGASGSLLLGASAQAIITGVHVVPVSFEQGWLNTSGSPISSGTSTTAISEDAAKHARVMAAWAASGGAYKTFRVYLTVDNLGTLVNGTSGDDVVHIPYLFESLKKDLSGPGNGFFNYQTGAIGSGQGASNAGPQAFGAAIANNAQAQRAYDSYLTVNGASAESNNGITIEAAATMFDAVRGRTGAAAVVQTGATGNGVNAISSINCENCGYLSLLPINGVAYSYNTAASLAANFGNPITGMGVLIGQFTVNAADGIAGNLLAVGTGTTPTPNYTFSFAANIPAPGALALLGLAGVAARRRRR